MSNKFMKLAGNTLIVLSLLGMGGIYLPLLQAYFYPPPQSLPAYTAFSISIPSIGAVAPIVENVNPWEKGEYLEALSHGVAHAKDTALPGQDGTMYLFAHSSDAPWRLTRYNTIFLRLGNLENGDEIKIRKEGVDYVYRVYDKKTVWPNEIDSLVNAQKNDSSGESLLIVQTCSPIGTDLMRLLVFASIRSISRDH